MRKVFNCTGSDESIFHTRAKLGILSILLVFAFLAGQRSQTHTSLTICENKELPLLPLSVNSTSIEVFNTSTSNIGSYQENVINDTNTMSVFIASNHSTRDVPCYDASLFGEYLIQKKPTCAQIMENLSSNMCLRTQTNVGNEAHFAKFLEKLASGQCVRILAMGGSVSVGYSGNGTETDGPGGRKDAWPTRLAELLNERYPCSTNSKTGSPVEQQHTVDNWSKHACGSDVHFRILRDKSSSSYLQTVDLVIFEAASNDVDMMLGKFKNSAEGSSHNLVPGEFWTEAIIRYMRVSHPSVAMLWFELVTRDWTWKPSSSVQHKRSKRAFACA